MLLAETSLPDPSSYSAIGWVIVVLISIVVGINQVSEMVARHKAKDPDPPLHKEYVGRAEFEALAGSIRTGNAQTADQIQKLREERSRSVGGLYERIEKSDTKNQEITAALRKEVKEDVEGVQHRVTDLLGAFRELKGVVERSLASRSPFSTDHK